MKIFSRLFLAVIFVSCFGHYAFCADTCKIGVVDTQKLQEKSEVFQKIRDKLAQKIEPLQQKLNNEKEEIGKLEEEFKKQSMLLSLDAKEDRFRELEKKKRHFKYSYEEFKQEMRNAEEDSKRVVYRDLQKVVLKIGKAEGLSLIIDKTMSGLIYSDDKLDITDKVIEAFDKKQD